MSDQPAKEPWSFWRVATMVVKITFLLFLLFLCLVVIIVLVGVPSIAQSLYHLSLGWLLHVWHVVPTLTWQWGTLVASFGSLVLAGVMLHRFARWWISKKGMAVEWKPKTTLSGMGIVLLMSGAAIAMSGIAHQLAWLASSPLTQGSHRTQLVMTIHSARELIMGLLIHESKHGRLPDSLDELDPPMRAETIWVNMRNGFPMEPFILLNPGGIASVADPVPVILSPVVQGSCVVGFSDGSLRVLAAYEFERVIQERALWKPMK